VDALWGAQTQRSLHFFAIGTQRMPIEVIHAMALIKWAAARVNMQLHQLDPVRANAIADAALRIAHGLFDDAFPLSVWQTGSGTQSHMNVNEVVAHIASAHVPVHANDDVNRGQSSNDVFPTAMHIAALQQMNSHLLPALHTMHQALLEKGEAFKGLIKVGRTHLQDATPVTLGQEFGGYAAQLALCEASITHAMGAVGTLAIGGTAVGTGLNTHPEFGVRVTALLAGQLGLSLVQADNLFAAIAGHEALVALHASLRMLAIALTKMANDIRLMGSGPRAGLGELQLPQNEAGSSIMPGKVNPTQIEALTMVCAQIMGHDVAIGIAAAQGQFELNVYKPLIALNVLDSIRLLGDAMRSFQLHCVVGISARTAQLERMLQQSLTPSMALTPRIGYDKSTEIARHAERNGKTLRESALVLGYVTADEFDEWMLAAQSLELTSTPTPR
jgi:fumarate hydratase class II